MTNSQNHFENRLPYAVPAVVGIIALAALAALPLVMNRRTNAIRIQMETTATPARLRLNEVNYLLSVQISSLSIAAATDDEGYLEDYRAASAARRRAMEVLGREAQQMGGNVPRRFAELENHVARWEEAVERAWGNEAAETAEIARESTYAAVIDDLRLLDNAMAAFEAGLSNELRRLLEMEATIAIVLVGAALLAAVALLMLQWRLHRLANGLTAALDRERESRKTAESLVRARDEILGIVSHDLRSPLTTISLSAQMMERNELVDTILATTKRMQRLIQDLLDAVKAESSGLSIRNDAVDLRSVTNEVVSSHALIAAKKGVELQSEVADELPPVTGDHDRLVQALANLLGNALKFTPEQGFVRLAVKADDDRIRCIVEDSGPGMSDSDLSQVFEPFWQAKKTAHLGAGLGLKITRGIVEAHGGSIRAMNRREGGARFEFEIPAAAERPAGSSA